MRYVTFILIGLSPRLRSLDYDLVRLAPAAFYATGRKVQHVDPGSGGSIPIESSLTRHFEHHLGWTIVGARQVACCYGCEALVKMH